MSEFLDKIQSWKIEDSRKNEIELNLPEAKNIIHFVLSPQFLGFSTLFPLQYKVLVGLFELICPYCNNDIDNTNVLDVADEKLNSLVLLEFGQCPRCKRTKQDLFNEGKIRFFNELVGVAGVKAGKTTLAGAMIAPYVLHKWILHNDEIREWANLLKWVNLQMVFIATSREQAKRTGWDYFSSVIDNSSWFKELFHQVKDFCNKNKIKEEDVFIKTATTLNLKWLNLEALCLHSNAFSIAGGTFIFALIDELSRFDNGLSKRSADEIFRVCKNNLLYIREVFNNKIDKKEFYNLGDIIEAFLISISAPLAEDDKIMQLLKFSPKLQKRFYFRTSTLDANPNIKRERLSMQAEEDNFGFMRDIEAEPTMEGIPYIGAIEIIKRAIYQNNDFLCDVKIEPFISGMIGDRTNVRYGVKLSQINFDRTSPFFIHADPGRTNDSFGIVIARLENLDNVNYKIKIVSVIDLNAKKNIYKKAFTEIDFDSVTEFILDICKNLSVMAVSFDRWNSISQVQKLRDNGLTVHEISLRYEDYLSFRQDLYAQKILFPCPDVIDWENKDIYNLEPKSKILKELYLLRDYGKRIDHPSFASNDLIVGAIAIHRVIVEQFLSQNKIIIQGRPRNLMRGRVVRLSRWI